jgi:hypothetical protein
MVVRWELDGADSWEWCLHLAANHNNMASRSSGLLILDFGYIIRTAIFPIN